jgi:hypothetical protein
MVRGMAINTTSVYYVDGNRAAINWGSAVSGGVATIPIFRLVVVDGHENINLWAYTGDAVSSAASTAAQAEITGGGVPSGREDRRAEFGPAQSSEDVPSRRPRVTGARTRSTSKGANIYELSLTGNVSAFDPERTSGRTGRVHRAALRAGRAPGSRTLGGPATRTSSWPAASLTLTTTASKRDVIRLRQRRRRQVRRDSAGLSTSDPPAGARGSASAAQGGAGGVPSCPAQPAGLAAVGEEQGAPGGARRARRVGPSDRADEVADPADAVRRRRRLRLLAGVTLGVLDGFSSGLSPFPAPYLGPTRSLLPCRPQVTTWARVPCAVCAPFAPGAAVRIPCSGVLARS